MAKGQYMFFNCEAYFWSVFRVTWLILDYKTSSGVKNQWQSKSEVPKLERSNTSSMLSLRLENLDDRNLWWIFICQVWWAIKKKVLNADHFKPFNIDMHRYRKNSENNFDIDLSWYLVSILAPQKHRQLLILSQLVWIRNWKIFARRVCWYHQFHFFKNIS